jgi:hypothetical protein
MLVPWRSSRPTASRNRVTASSRLRSSTAREAISAASASAMTLSFFCAASLLRRSSSGLSRLPSALATVLGRTLGRPTLHGRAFPDVAGQRCRAEEVPPGTTMLPGAAEQVAGDRWQ